MRDIEGRFDPLYYSGAILGIFNSIKFKLVPLKSIIKHVDSGIGAGKQDQAEKTKGILQIRPTNIDNHGQLKFDKNIYIPKNTLYKYLNKGDVLFNNTNSQELVGKTAFFNLDENMTFSNHITRIKVNSEIIEPKFLFFILNFYQTKKIFFNLCTNWNNQSGVGLEVLKNLKIPLPPKPIQQQIVNIMDNTYNIKKSKETKAKNLLNSIDDYLLSELGITLPKKEKNKKTFIVNSSEVLNSRFDPFYHKTYFKELEKSLNSGKYKTEKLKNLIINLKTGTTPHQNLNPFNNEGLPFLRNINLKPFEIDLRNVKFIKEELDSNLIYSYKNEVIVCIAGTIGTSAINKYDEIIINQNVTSLKLKETFINPNYLVAFFNSKVSIELMKRKSSVATILYLNNENLKSLQIPLPDIDTQNKIANHIKATRDKAKKLQQEAKEELKGAKMKVEKIILGE